MPNKPEIKTITVNEETYNRLKKLKKHPRQSFNEVVGFLLDEHRRGSDQNE
ncbi:antitoxin VapB family protein [bacterium]|nr:antitoxin VapB family protein [bacterium]